MAKTRRVPSWQRAIVVLSGTVVGLTVVFALWWGKPVLIPIALAALLTFLLNPLISRLQRLGLPRVPAVVIAISAVGLVFAGVGWSVSRQVGSLMSELPQNTANLVAKARSLRQMGSSPLIGRFEQMFKEINEEWKNSARPPDSSSDKANTEPSGTAPSPANPVLVHSESSPWLYLTEYLSSTAEVFVTLAFALVLLVCFLLGREDLRDRIVLLAGKAHLSLTSKALEEVTDRISRYILMVAMLNGGFGLVLTGGLLALQVPYALLWGFLAGGMRFIPYIGPWIGAIFPIAMSVAISDGWWQPLSVFFFVMTLELISNNIIEPLAFGRSTGVSPTALLISAAFWLFLWGPVGLVLSAPIAVCLVVLGRTVPSLGFLNLILGDDPALRANVSLYQRLMLGDQPEAARQVVQGLKSTSVAQVYDEMLIPALNYAKRDVFREQLTAEDQTTVMAGVREALRQCDEFRHAQAQSTNRILNSDEDVDGVPATSQPLVRRKILGCPAKDESDSMALEMLERLLGNGPWELETTSEVTLTSELVERLIQNPPAVVCIAALPPGELSQARYLCKRLREASPEIPIIVGRWGKKRGLQLDREQLTEAGASVITESLAETLRYLDSRLPLVSSTAKPAMAEAY